MKEIGPAEIIIDPKHALTPQLALRLLRLLADTEYYTVKNPPGELERHASNIAEGVGLWGATRWDWEPWTEIRASDPLSYAPSSAMHLDKFGYVGAPYLGWKPRQVIFKLHFARAGTRYLHPFPPYEQRERVEFLLQMWKRTLELFEPAFSVIDDYGFNIHKRKGTDLRQRSWGVTVYGPEFAEILGRDLLLKAPAFRVDELPWGGVWVQLAENPFTVPAGPRREMEKYLDLKGHFGKEGA